MNREQAARLLHLLEASQDPENRRLLALQCAMDTASHAITAVGAILEDGDFGEDYWTALELVGDDLHRKAREVEQRNGFLSVVGGSDVD